MMGAHFCLRMGQSAMANKTTLADCYRSSSGTTISGLLKYLKDGKLTFLQAFFVFHFPNCALTTMFTSQMVRSGFFLPPNPDGIQTRVSQFSCTSGPLNQNA